jgi:hypothetical protein
MNKKQFIALADAIRDFNKSPKADYMPDFTEDHLNVLADFCASQNHKFMPNRWLAYVKGECGPNGGALK